MPVEFEIKKLNLIMSILEAKIELAKMVLDIEDESLIKRVKGLLSLSQEEDFELPNWQKELLDFRMESAKLNPELIKSGEDLFENL
jgi:hypothetical protein